MQVERPRWADAHYRRQEDRHQEEARRRRLSIRDFIIVVAVALAGIPRAHGSDLYTANGLDQSDYTLEAISYARIRPADQASLLVAAQPLVRKFPDLKAVIQTKIPSHGTAGHALYDNTAGLKALGLVYMSFTVSGIAAADLYLVDHNDACIRVPDNRELVEGRSYHGFVTRAGVFEYVTVLGSARRIAKYEYVFDEDVTAKDLEKHLAEGNTLFIPHVRAVTCPECHGQGRRTFRKDVWARGQITKNKLVSEDCPHCRGKKTVNVPLIYALTK